MIQQTSLETYTDLKKGGELGRRQKLVYEALIHLQEATDMEICKFLGFSDGNMVKPRRNELVKYGLVKEAGKRECFVTGRRAIIWKIIT